MPTISDPTFLARRFLDFAEAECRESSPLYASLSQHIARDADLLEIAACARPGQPAPNLFFAAVHYLLFEDRTAPPAAFYASLCENPRAAEQAFAPFKAYAVSRRADIGVLLETRFVQTNEVRRCAYLYPAFIEAGRLAPGRALALVEIGTSAGLNLRWDCYRYDFADGALHGTTTSPVQISAAFRGDRRPAAFEPVPPVARRIGIDLNIVDVTLPDEARWLRALVWPEHRDRRRLLDAALTLPYPPALDLRTGDGVALLSGIIGEIPDDELVCVFHTHVANQLPPPTRARLLDIIETISRHRDVLHLHNNILPHFHLEGTVNGRRIDLTLARTEGHARWIEWLA